MTLLNCTSYDNGEANYRIQRVLNPGQTLTIKNSVSLDGAVQLGTFAVQETNSWLSSVVVTADDFLSLDVNLASAPRQPDGSLPDIAFLHLADGSDLIDAGVDLGFPFKGDAPDLGAFESDFISSVAEHFLPNGYRLLQNYPNPFNPTTTIGYAVTQRTYVEIKVYDVIGREVAELVNGVHNAGDYEIVWDARGYASGVYYYRISAGAGNFTAVRKLVLMK